MSQTTMTDNEFAQVKKRVDYLIAKHEKLVRSAHNAAVEILKSFPERRIQLPKAPFRKFDFITETLCGTSFKHHTAKAICLTEGMIRYNGRSDYFVAIEDDRGMLMDLEDTPWDIFTVLEMIMHYGKLNNEKQ